MHFSHHRYSANFVVLPFGLLGKRFIAAREERSPVIDLLPVGLLLLFLGVAIVLLALSLQVNRDRHNETKVGGVVMIGPVPIIFGSDAKWASIALVLAIVLVALGLLYYVI